MTFKQTLKVISIIASILATIGIFVVGILYDSSTNYSIFEKTISKDGFNFPLFISIFCTIAALGIGFLSVSYDSNKVFPIIIIILAIIAFIIGLNARSLAGMNLNQTAHEKWMSRTKPQIGIILLVAGNIVACLGNAIITFRAFVLKLDEDIIDTEEIDENEETDDNKEPEQKDWFEVLGENKPNEENDAKEENSVENDNNE